MKIYTSEEEGVFVEHLTYELTDSEKDVTKGKSESAKAKLKGELVVKTKKNASKTKAAKLKKIYENHKPKLKDTDEYVLIGVEFYDEASGIINCRINGEHKQIRF